jgi:hypothetical protein
METETNTEGTELTPEIEALIKERVESAKRGPITELTKAQAELEELRTAEADRERAEMEAKGELEKLLELTKSELATKQAELETTRKTYETERTTSALDRALEREGVDNGYTRKGILGDYLELDEKPDVAEFIAKLKENTPDIFATAAIGAGTKNKAAGVAKQTGSLSDDQVDAMLKSSNPEEKQRAQEHILRDLGLDKKRF